MAPFTGRALDQGHGQRRRIAVFVDRDGVINANRADHVLNWSQFQFLPGALKGLAALTAARLPIVVVTNQATVSRGMLKAEELDAIHARMCQAVQTAGGSILDVLYCPHDSSANCSCRKPEPGLFHHAAEKYELDLSRSFYVGDALTDLVAGNRAGCRCVLVSTGRGRTQLLRDEARFIRDYHQAGDLYSAARWIQAQVIAARSGKMGAQAN